LGSELERFLVKIDVLRQLFDFTSPPRKNHAYARVSVVRGMLFTALHWFPTELAKTEAVVSEEGVQEVKANAQEF